MDLNLTVTGIARVIYVSKDEYPREYTAFPANLPYHELVYSVSGEHTVYLGENVIENRPGQIRIMAKGDHGRYEVHRRIRGDCFDVFFSTEKPLDAPLFIRDFSGDRAMEELFRRIFSLWVAKHPGYYAECMSVLYQILARMQRDGEYVDAHREELIRPAVTYLEENFNREDISCEALAARCGISYSYLKQIFVRRYRLSPKQYLLRLRLNCACDLLLSERYTVGQAAQMSGFSDPYFFSKYFKKTVGVSPSEYRKKFRSSK